MRIQWSWFRFSLSLCILINRRRKIFHLRYDCVFLWIFIFKSTAKVFFVLWEKQIVRREFFLLKITFFIENLIKFNRFFFYGGSWQFVWDEKKVGVKGFLDFLRDFSEVFWILKMRSGFFWLLEYSCWDFKVIIQNSFSQTSIWIEKNRILLHLFFVQTFAWIFLRILNIFS